MMFLSEASKVDEGINLFDPNKTEVLTEKIGIETKDKDKLGVLHSLILPSCAHP